MERNFIDGYTEWQANPEIVGVNRLPQHATLMPYENFDEAKKADRYASSRCKLLNGKWKFKLYKNYAYKPSDFAQPHYDAHNWDSIIVPGSWQMQGYDVLVSGEGDLSWYSEEQRRQKAIPSAFEKANRILQKWEGE